MSRGIVLWLDVAGAGICSPVACRLPCPALTSCVGSCCSVAAVPGAVCGHTHSPRAAQQEMPDPKPAAKTAGALLLSFMALGHLLAEHLLLRSQ